VLQAIARPAQPAQKSTLIFSGEIFSKDPSPMLRKRILSHPQGLEGGGGGGGFWSCNPTMEFSGFWRMANNICGGGRGGVRWWRLGPGGGGGGGGGGGVPDLSRKPSAYSEFSDETLKFALRGVL